MLHSSTLRPLGFVFSAEARQAVTNGLALYIGGSEVGFTLAEIRKRHEDGTVSTIVASVPDLAVLYGEETERLLERVIAPRPAFAGLSMDRPSIMGIVNVTPDSFSDGGQFASAEEAIDHALRLEDEGADILDIGGESTRPGAEFVPVDEERKRVLPVIDGLTGRVEAKISIDTRKAAIMEEAAKAGADIINDVSALTFDEQSLAVAAKSGLPVILMHALGTPQTMQDNPQYDDVLIDIYSYLEDRILACEQAGIARDKLMVDPGIGFGKTLEHNLTLLAGIGAFHSLGVPILLGASRKRLIGELADKIEPSERVPGSIAAALSSILQGVQCVRVHDVAETRQAINVWRASLSGQDDVLHVAQGV